jgi:hypothetical protein
VGFGSIQTVLLLVETCLADRILVDGRGEAIDADSGRCALVRTGVLVRKADADDRYAVDFLSRDQLCLVYM